jgi:hypothetical protein
MMLMWSKFEFAIRYDVELTNGGGLRGRIT